MEYKTVSYNAGIDLDAAINIEVAQGWAVLNIWKSPNKEFYSTGYDFIITYVKGGQKQYETK